MSRRIFRDIEEALSREVRRITFHNYRTLDEIVLQDTFDPFTGEIIQAPVQPNFYDSSADTNAIQYPHFFVKLLKSREDRFTGRVVPEYGRWISTSVTTAPKAFEIIAGSSDGSIAAPGNTITTTVFKIRSIVAGSLLRLLNGNNKGTYEVLSVTPSNSGPHTITVSNNIVLDLPASLFTVLTRVVTFTGPTDLNTVKIGDNYIDFGSNSFPITAININANTITLGGVGTPILTAGSKIQRSGNIFTLSDPSPVRFIVMDPNQPVEGVGLCGPNEASSANEGRSPSIPIDAWYLIRIDSKERDSHVDVLNRMWEEFNPPRTGLPVIVRSALSAEQLLTVDVTSGGSPTLTVADNSKFKLNEPVFVFDDYLPSKDVVNDGFERPFESKVVGLIGTTQVQLADTVPDTFLVENRARVVSNATYQLLMFHFVDHVTKDVESAQYWVHEFTFWVQLWIDRLEDPKEYTTITDIATPIEDLNGNIIIDDT